MFSLSFVDKLHKEIIKSTGGSYGIRDENILKSSLEQPFQTFEGKDLYKTTLEKASKLLELIIKNHPFIDGNKRIGYVLYRLFLEENGYIINATEEEKYQFIINIASGKMSYEEILNWTIEHTRKWI